MSLRGNFLSKGNSFGMFSFLVRMFSPSFTILQYNKTLVSGMKTLLSSPLLSTNLKIKIYKKVILPVVLYDCETWSLT